MHEPPMRYTLYEVNHEVADISEMPSNEELFLRLTTKSASGRLAISSGREVKMHLEPDEERATESVSLVLPFPLDAEFHLLEYYDSGRRIDKGMPVGEWYSSPLGYNLFLANVEGMWIRFMTKQLRLGSASVHISRHPEVFIVTFTWKASGDACISVFSSMEEAITDYETWLKKEFGVKKMREDPNVPEWVHNVKLVLTTDMMRSNWEITHDYNDVINLAEELGKIGCPKDTLFYIPGWNGPYDSSYPWRPHPELGGKEKFREMVDTLHKNGFRVMIHTDSWGIDPYSPEIDEYIKYVVKDDEGHYEGWQTGGKIWGVTAPESRPLKFRTDKIKFHGRRRTKSFMFETVYIPDMCEALAIVGNLKVGDACVKFTIDRRSMSTPPGWFQDHDEYAFPAPFQLKTGINKVQVEVIGEAEPDWSESWYKIRYCFVPMNRYNSFTFPMYLADVNNPEYIRIFVDAIASVATEYKIDAVHIDATEYSITKQLLQGLRGRLPKVAMACEAFGTLEALGFWTFSQGARQSLVGYLNVMQGTLQQDSLPDTSRIMELYSWLNEPSPIRDFLKHYIYFYPHLCAADAFVPVGKVCNIFPPRLSPRDNEELWKVLREARRLNYIPGLRVNYREYGLDEQTKKAIREIGEIG